MVQEVVEIAALRGDLAPQLEHQQVGAHSLHLPRHESSAYRYCTNFAVTGKALESTQFAPQLEEIGDSVLVEAAREGEAVACGSPHPDNVAPAAYGGFVIAGHEGDAFYAAQSPVDPSVSAVVYVPSTPVETKVARGLLPTQVPHADAAANAWR